MEPARVESTRAPLSLPSQGYTLSISLDFSFPLDDDEDSEAEPRRATKPRRSDRLRPDSRADLPRVRPRRAHRHACWHSHAGAGA